MTTEWSMYITKASLGRDGIMRWAGTASDVLPDRADERTSLELFRDFIERAEGEPPFVSVSHYPREAGEAGMVSALYIDGQKFKAKGQFHDTSLGRAAFEAVRRDMLDGTPPEKRIRFSIGFFDLAHRHGDKLYIRQGPTDCPMCNAGLGDKVYVKGKLDHLALTRVPCNPRTDVRLEVKSMTTRKQDASDIIGEELAEEMDERAKLVGKSETPELVIKVEEPSTSPDDAPPPAEPVVKTEPEPEPVVDAVAILKADREAALAAQKARSEKYGISVRDDGHVTKPSKWADVPDAEWGDPVNYLYPCHDKAHAANAMARFAANQDEYDDESAAKVEGRIRRLEKKQGVEAAKMDSAEAPYYPYGGATSFEAAEAYLTSMNQVSQAMGAWWMLQDIVGNIMSDPSLEDKGSAIRAALDECRDRIEMKALITMADLQSDKSESELRWEALRLQVGAAKTMKASLAERLATVQPGFEALAVSIRQEIEGVPEPSEVVNERVIEAAVGKAVATVKADFESRIAQLQTTAPRPPEPKRKSLTFDAYPTASKPRSALHAQVRKSVFLNE